MVVEAFVVGRVVVMDLVNSIIVVAQGKRTENHEVLVSTFDVVRNIA